MPTSEEQLSERQREVLVGLRAGKTPTEIGAEIGITSQAVHGHMRRLRQHGLIPDEPTKPGRAAARAASEGRNGRLKPADTVAAAQRAVQEQLGVLDGRLAEIGEERIALDAEEREIEENRQRLARMLDVPE